MTDWPRCTKYSLPKVNRVDTPNLRNMSRRPTAVEGDIFWFICCLLVFVTGLPTLSTATRLTTKFETAQVSIGSSSQPKSQVSFQTISKGNRSGVRDFQQRIVRNHIAHQGPIVIDARMKPTYPKELFCDEATANLVSRRWREYFPSREIEMGDSARGHLD